LPARFNRLHTGINKRFFFIANFFRKFLDDIPRFFQLQTFRQEIVRIFPLFYPDSECIFNTGTNLEKTAVIFNPLSSTLP